MSTFGERLREARKGRGLSQSAFADIGGVQKRAQINYEADERRPDSDYLAAIAAAGVDVRYVITGERSTAEETQIQRAAQLMKDTTRKATDLALPLERQIFVRDILLGVAMDNPNLLNATIDGFMTTHTPPKGTKAQQTFQGEVGQVVQADGDIRNKKQVFNVGTRKKK